MNTKPSVKPKEIKRQAILWGRFSDPKQRDGDSRDRQERLNRALAAREGIHVIKEYFDEGISVKTGQTPLFKKIIADLPEGVGIIAENLDRIDRSHPWVQKANIYAIIQKGHFIITTQDVTEYNQATVNDMGTVAKGDLQTNVANAENVKRINRVREEKAKAIQLAREKKPSPLGGWLPSYLRYNFDTKQYDFNDEIAGITERIFKEYVKGYGTSRIAARLNDDNIPTFGSKKIGCWTRSSISEHLRYEGVIGTLNIKGERIPKAFPSAIKESLFFKVKGMLEKNKDRHGNYASDTINNVFRGKMHCSHCGASMKVYKKRALGCSGYREKRKDENGKTCPIKAMIPFRQLEYELTKWFVHIANEMLIKDETKADLLSLEAKEALLVKRIDETLSDYDNPLMPRDRIHERLIKLETERKKVQGEIASVKVNQSRNIPHMFEQLQSLIGQSISNHEVRKKIAVIVPTLIEDIKVDLADREKATFKVILADGTISNWVYASQKHFRGKITEGFYEMI